MMKATLAALALLSLAGCASVFDPNGATSSYTCESPNDPDAATDGVTCKTPFAIYKSTHGAPAVRQSDLPIGVSMKDYESGQYQAPGTKDPNEGMPHPATGMTYRVPGGMGADNQPEFARPVRAPAQIMRIWIAPWIDKSDDLHFPSYVYTEIQPRRWTFGAEAFNGRGMVMPAKTLGTVPGGRVSNGHDAKPQTQRPAASSGPQQSHLDTGAQLPKLPTQ